MGRHRILNLLLLPAMLLAVSTSAQEAAAGYIAPGVGQQDALSSLSGMSSSATESEATRSLVTLTDWIHHVASPTPGGMTPQSTTATSPSSAPSALPLAAEPLATTQLIIWLGPSGKIWLPPPFSTGIFRPPRYVG